MAPSHAPITATTTSSDVAASEGAVACTQALITALADLQPFLPKRPPIHVQATWTTTGERPVDTPTVVVQMEVTHWGSVIRTDIPQEMPGQEASTRRTAHQLLRYAQARATALAAARAWAQAWHTAPVLSDMAQLKATDGVDNSPSHRIACSIGAHSTTTQGTIPFHPAASSSRLTFELGGTELHAAHSTRVAIDVLAEALQAAIAAGARSPSPAPHPQATSAENGAGGGSIASCHAAGVPLLPTTMGVLPAAPASLASQAPHILNARHKPVWGPRAAWEALTPIAFTSGIAPVRFWTYAGGEGTPDSDVPTDRATYTGWVHERLHDPLWQDAARAAHQALHGLHHRHHRTPFRLPWTDHKVDISALGTCLDPHSLRTLESALTSLASQMRARFPLLDIATASGAMAFYVGRPNRQIAAEVHDSGHGATFWLDAMGQSTSCAGCVHELVAAGLADLHPNPGMARVQRLWMQLLAALSQGTRLIHIGWSGPLPGRVSIRSLAHQRADSEGPPVGPKVRRIAKALFQTLAEVLPVCTPRADLPPVHFQFLPLAQPQTAPRLSLHALGRSWERCTDLAPLAGIPSGPTQWAARHGARTSMVAHFAAEGLTDAHRVAQACFPFYTLWRWDV